jgi:bacillithiol synthase
MPRLEHIPFRRIPNQSRLFLDYLDRAPEAFEFYRAAPDYAHLEETARRAEAGPPAGRKQVVSILHRQNRRFGADPVTARHIDELANPSCVAIVTGQQVGLFSGPLYTFYKALTTIRIAATLRSRGIQAVPLFWMDTEDHDLAEITHVTVVPPGGPPRRVDFRNILYGEVPAGAEPVGSRELPEAIAWAVSEFIEALPEGEHKQATASILESAYVPGETYADSFARLMADMFRGHGLVLFDPDDAQAKELLAGVFTAAINGAGEIHSLMLDRNRELEQRGYHSQVTVQEQSTVLFLRHEGERRAVTREGTGFGLKNTTTHFAADDLIRLAAAEPARFSPNVLLRPIVQDSLFPTAAYVAGPAEIAYFAQIQTLYPLFGRTMPVIWPRSSLTLLEPEISARMDAYKLAAEDCFTGKHELVKKMVLAGGRSDSMVLLRNLRQTLDSSLEHLRPRLVATDASLGPALLTAGRKLYSHLDGLQARFVHLEAGRNGEIERVAGDLLAHLRPNGNLQERELNVTHFMARFGPALAQDVLAVVGTGNFEHAALRLGHA